MKATSIMNNQKGMALVIALVMLLVLTLVGLSAVSMTNFETNISGNQRVYNLAFYTADGGVENFRGRVSGGEFIYSAVSTGSYQVTIGGNQCNVSYSKWNRTDAEGDFTVFKILSDGRPPFPSTGRVTIESIIEVLMIQQEGYN
jgi:Tfp pilus assembly protein PilX